jgi:hypothetical protein
MSNDLPGFKPEGEALPGFKAVAAGDSLPGFVEEAAGLPGFVVEAAGASVLDTLKSLPDRFSLGLHTAASNIRKTFVDNDPEAMVDPATVEIYERFPESPAAKAYFAEKLRSDTAKREGGFVEQAAATARPAGAEQSLFDEIVGGAAESLAPSLSGLATFAATRSPALASAVGLGTNFVAETAGAEANALAEGATPQQAGRSAGITGIVSTALEKAQLDTLMKAGGSAAKKVLKFGGQEFLQEGTTSVAGDVESNVAGYTELSAGEIAARGAKAGATGIVMAGAMSPVVAAVHRRKPDEIAVRTAEAVAAQKGLERDLMESIGVEVDPAATVSTVGLDRTPLTPKEAALAEVHRRQADEGLDAPNVPEGDALGASLDQAMLPGVEEDADLGGITPEVHARRVAEYQETTVPFAERTIRGSSDGRVVGLSLGQLNLQPGHVVAIGALDEEGNHDTRNFSEPYVEWLTKTVKNWTDKHMPDARIVLNLEMMDPGKNQQAFGNHRLAHDGQGLVHVITPKELPGLKYDGGDPRTRAGAALGLSHEFGHALKFQSFFTALEPGVAQAVSQELGKTGQLSAETFASMPESAEKALLGTWMTLRAKALSGEMSAQEFVEQWVGSRKIGWAMLRQNADKVESMAWARERLAATGKPLEAATALDLIKAAYGSPKYALNFDEFMAEQYSRAALTNDYFKAHSQLNDWFRSALNRLRGFFRELKKEKMVAPQTTFQDWLTAREVALQGAKRSKKMRLSPEVKAARERIFKEARAKAAREEAKAAGVVESSEAPDSEAEVKAAPPAQSTLTTSVDVRGNLESKVRDLIDMGALAEDSKLHEVILKRIEQGDFEAARVMMQRALDKIGGSWDREYTTRAIEKLPNKEKLSTEALKQVAGMQGIRKQDKEKLAQFIALGATISREDLVREILAGNVPLEHQATENMADWGIGRLFTGAARAAAIETSRSNLWRAPVPLGEQGHWPGDPNVFGHTRSFDLAGVRHVFEVQSDFVQKLGAEEPPQPEVFQTQEIYVEGAKQDFVLLMDLLEEIVAGGLTAELRQDLALYGQEYLEMAEELVVPAIHGQGRTLWEGYKAAQDVLESMEKAIRQARAEVQYIAETLAPRWWERLLQEENTRAFEEGLQTVRLATADTVAKVELWTPTAMTGKFLPDHQGIYDRHKRDVEGFARKHFGAQPVSDAQGNTWLEWDTAVKGSKVVSWDRENSELPNLPLTTPASVANLGPDQLRNPSVVADAAKQWKTKGFQSPYFQRWFGDSKVTKFDGTPVEVWHGTGGKITFLDPTLRGSLTGVSSARKVFWFSENRAQAEWYAKQAAMGKQILPPEFQRKAQQLRDRIQKAEGLLGKLSDAQKATIGKAVERDKLALKDLQANAVPAYAHIQNYALKMSIPLVKDAGGKPYDNKLFTEWLNEAQAKGRDGLIIRNTADPMPGTVYAVFEPEQAKALLNAGTFDWTDELHWDSESRLQQDAKNALKPVAAVLQDIYGKGKLKAWNTVVKGWDAILQLQQEAQAAMPNGQVDATLRHFSKLTDAAERLKNSLQVKGEDVAKRMQALPREQLALMDRVLQGEWKNGAHTTLLEQLSEDPIRWQHQPGEAFRNYLEQLGVNTETEDGERLAQLVLDYKNAIQTQLDSLEQALTEQLADKYANRPLELRGELAKLDAVMSRIRGVPLYPQGRFGDYVVLVKKRVFDEQRLRMKWVVARQQHFESEEARRLAYEKLKAASDKDENLKVVTKNLEPYTSRAIGLPSDLLEQVAATGEFAEDQIEQLADLMTPLRYERLAKKYDAIISQVAGAEEDPIRNFTNFIWHNGNYTWKTRMRKEFERALREQSSQIRALERRRSTNPQEIQLIADLVDTRRRHKAIMQKTKDYLLTPPPEWQTARTWVTLAYLGYNVKTAALNATTQINTWAALTTEYGEVAGNKIYAGALRQAAGLWTLETRADGAEGAEQKRLMELRNLVNMAVQDGVVDQSYAYFLAGQANGFDMARAFKRSPGGKAARVVLEAGMWPFRMIEKANRWVTLIAFYEAERGKGTGVTRAYEIAVEKTNLLQNAYTQGNKPDLFRGKKGILFMFASYAQFMGWITTGGYERGARRQQREQGRTPASAWHGTTAKIWLIYLMLAGLSGVPFAQNLLDMAQFLWRKMFGGTENIELEIRKFVEDLGMNPNLAMNGLAHNAFGFDLSGSMGLGSLLPGTDALGKNSRTFEEAVGAGVMKGTGAAGGFVADVLKVAGMTYGMAGGESTVRGSEMMKEMPGVIGAVGKTLDAVGKQNLRETYGVTTKSGERMVQDLETGEFRNLTEWEIVGTLLGANPTVLAQNRALNHMENGEKIYWMTRRGKLLDDYFKVAWILKDAEGVEDMNRAIGKYNEAAVRVDPRLKITGKVTAASVKARRAKLRKEEQLGTSQKMMRGVVKDVQKGFEPED